MIWFKYFFALIALAGFYGLNPTPSQYNTLCLGLILLLGVPHGAADHKINATLSQGQSSYGVFITKYIILSIGYLLWWVFMPVKAMVIFLILSGYHFGQEYLENLKLSKPKNVEIMIWGSAILLGPMFICYPEISLTTKSLLSMSLPDISRGVQLTTAFTITGVASVHLILLFFRNQISKGDLRIQLGNLWFLVFCYLTLPFLMAFTLYFLFFHAFNAFKHQYSWLQKNAENYSVKSFIVDLSPFSIVSIVGMVLLFFLVKPSGFQEIIMWFFALISIVTLPHSILFDQFYKERSTPSKG